MAMVSGDRTPAEWFHAAVRSYDEEHQGCAHCRNRHCVFRSRWGDRIEYYCSACDFSTSHDRAADRFYAAMGDGRQLAASLFNGHPQPNPVAT
jgi:hypothetical protein